MYRFIGRLFTPKKGAWNNHKNQPCTWFWGTCDLEEYLGCQPKPNQCNNYDDDDPKPELSYCSACQARPVCCGSQRRCWTTPTQQNDDNNETNLMKNSTKMMTIMKRIWSNKPLKRQPGAVRQKSSAPQTHESPVLLSAPWSRSIDHCHNGYNDHHDVRDGHGDHYDGHGTGTLPVQERVKQVSKEVVGDAGAELPTCWRFPGSCQQLSIQVHHLKIGELLDLYHKTHFLGSTYSLVRLVWQNTEELISRSFSGLYKIRLLLQDCLTSRYLRF